MAGENALVAKTLFSEVSKKSKDIEKDAPAIAWTIINRTSRPERFGATIQDVIYAPKQFSGVGSNEWNKVETGKMNEAEQKIYKRLLQISNGVLTGKITDPTGGADHYFNPKLVKPSWSKKMKKTYSSGAHDYYKE